MPRSHHRSRHRRKPSRRRLLTALAIGISIAIAVVAGLRFVGPDDERPRVVAFEIGNQADTVVDGGDVPYASFGRPDYRYSVIPGGAYDPPELRRAIQDDPVVAAHYRDLDRSRLKVETVSHDRYVHVSYRRGDQIFWTKNKVLLRQGETILTDGKTQIRARCGNCISEQPLLPTSESEPEVVEFDRLTEGVPAPTVPDSLPLPTDPVATVVPLSPGDSSEVLTPLASDPFRSGIYAPMASRTLGEPIPPGPLTEPETLGNPTPTPRFDVPPIFTPSSEVPPPGANEPLVPPIELFPNAPDNPPVHNPLTNPETPPGSPSDPVPVPEPGTLLLVGGGVAALLRTLRSRTRS